MMNLAFAPSIAPSVLPLFFAMCYGATLGSNATLLGAGSNIIAGGIAARAGRPISFLTFLRYGVPVTLVRRWFPRSTFGSGFSDLA